MEAWVALDRYLGVIEIRAADSRAGNSRIVAKAMGSVYRRCAPPPSHLTQHHTSGHSEDSDSHVGEAAAAFGSQRCREDSQGLVVLLFIVPSLQNRFSRF
jgi:hypothetical protein